jgi:hypothetical protein
MGFERSSVKRGWHYNNQTRNLEAYNNGNEIFQYPFGANFYVDDVNGSATGTGLSWATAFSTISLAMTAAAALGASTVRRGGVDIFVAPGSYTEDIITPLNTECPFGSLIGINPVGQLRTTGAAWIISSTTSNPALTIRARGWVIDGLEFDANTTSGCILLDGTTSDANCNQTQITNCHFAGLQSGTTDFGIEANTAATLSVVKGCMFQGFGGEAITATDFPLQWEIADNYFDNCQKYIAPQSTKGFQQAWIHDNSFNQIGGTFTATVKIDTRGGAQNHIGPNNFLGGTYDNAGGYYASGTDYWRGNHSADSENGSAQANPTA